MGRRRERDALQIKAFGIGGRGGGWAEDQALYVVGWPEWQGEWPAWAFDTPRAREAGEAAALEPASQGREKASPQGIPPVAAHLWPASFEKRTGEP